MKHFLLLIILVLCTTACSNSKKGGKEEPQQKVAEESKATNPTPDSEKKSDGDQYKLVLRHVDNRAVVYINDSTIFDTGDMPAGPYEKEIDLTEYVKTGKTDLKVELYNSNPPKEAMKPGWMIVYDIFANDELVDFIREQKNESTVGLVYTEVHDLKDML